MQILRLDLLNSRLTNLEQLKLCETIGECAYVVLSIPISKDTLLDIKFVPSSLRFCDYLSSKLWIMAFHGFVAYMFRSFSTLNLFWVERLGRKGLHP